MTQLSAIVVAALLFAPAVAAAQQSDNPSTVSSTGTGVVMAAPDRAWITISAESRAGNPREAQRRNAEAMTPVLARLRSAGVPEEAIRTIGYDLQQEWDFVDGRRVSRGYVARNTVEVRVDDITRVGELLEVAVSSGATSVSGVRFDVKDRAKLEAEALRLAVTEARGKVDAMAAAAGVTIERILRIDEMSAAPRPVPVMAMARAAEASDAPPIAPGEMEIRANVTLTAVIR